MDRWLDCESGVAAEVVHGHQSVIELEETVFQNQSTSRGRPSYHPFPMASEKSFRLRRHMTLPHGPVTNLISSQNSPAVPILLSRKLCVRRRAVTGLPLWGGNAFVALISSHDGA
jgi:hypothetical protein